MSNTNATRIGNRVGSATKERPKPKPREICPRFQPSITYNSSIRSKNQATTRLGMSDNTKLNAAKKPSMPLLHSKPNSSQSTKNATPSYKRVDSARNRPQTAKSIAKPTAV